MSSKAFLKTKTRISAERLRRNMTGVFGTAPRTRTGTVVGAGQVRIGDQRYTVSNLPSSAQAGQSLRVRNVGRRAAAAYVPDTGGGTILAAGGSSGSAGGGAVSGLAGLRDDNGAYVLPDTYGYVRIHGDGAGILTVVSDSVYNIGLGINVNVIDHNDLAGLTTGDPHTQYPLLSGAETIEGLWSFSRSTNAPFAVNSGAAKVANLDADKLDGLDATDFLSPQYLTLATNSNLTGERVLLAGDGLTLSDGGAGGNATLAVGVYGLGLGLEADAVTLASSSNPGAAASILATDASGYLNLVRLKTDTIADRSGGNLTISPAGDVVFDPVGNDILPATNYDLNIGALSKKYLTLHAAELWVETLVAQETIATIGGRILVGPTTTLTRDLGSDAGTDTTIYVKHNQLASGDRVYMEANGKVEFMAVTSSYTTISATEYSYTVTRTLDPTGANQWYAGDAIFNTGTTGDGWIDLYSVQGMKPGVTQAGPSIVGNVRNSSTYNDWSEHWAVGNLNGLYGYGVTTYGAAFGKYASGQPWVSVDATNGFRINNYNTVVGQWATDGTWSISGDGSHYIEWDLSALNIYGSLYVSQSLGAGGGGANGEDGGLISVSDWGMIEIGENGVITMGADSSFAAGTGSTFTIGTQGTGAYLSYADGVLSIEGMLTVTDGADFLPAAYRPVAISASFDRGLFGDPGEEEPALVSAPPYEVGEGIAGRLEMADGSDFHLLAGGSTCILNVTGSRFFKVCILKDAEFLFPDGHVTDPVTTGGYNNVVYVFAYSLEEWAALNSTQLANRIVIADAYLSADFSELVTLTMRADSSLSIITPDFIRTPHLSALSADLGSVTAGTITVTNGSNTLWLNNGTDDIVLAAGATAGGIADAAFKVWENGNFAAGDATSYIAWVSPTLYIKGTIQATAGYLNGLTVDGNLTMNGGQIRWNSNNSYIDNSKIVISETSGYSITRIGDTGQLGLIDIDMFYGGAGAWLHGIHITDAGSSSSSVSSLFHGESAIAGVSAIDRIFDARTSNGAYSDGYYAEIASFNGWADFDTAGVAFKGMHLAGGPVALFNQAGGGADAPVVWATSQNTNRSIIISEMGANGQQGFRVERNGYLDTVGLNADDTSIKKVTFMMIKEVSDGDVPNPDAGYVNYYHSTIYGFSRKHSNGTVVRIS